MADCALSNDPDFLLYYASVLEREAAARPRQNVAWMLEGAVRARREATRQPAQGDLFAGAAA